MKMSMFHLPIMSVLGGPNRVPLVLLSVVCIESILALNKPHSFLAVGTSSDINFCKPWMPQYFRLKHPGCSISPETMVVKLLLLLFSL